MFGYEDDDEESSSITGLYNFNSFRFRPTTSNNGSTDRFTAGILSRNSGTTMTTSTGSSTKPNNDMLPRTESTTKGLLVNRMETIPLTPLFQTASAKRSYSLQVCNNNEENLKYNLHNPYQHYSGRSPTSHLKKTMFQVDENDENRVDGDSMYTNQFRSTTSNVKLPLAGSGRNTNDVNAQNQTDQRNTTSGFAIASALIANSAIYSTCRNKKDSESIKENLTYSHGSSQKRDNKIELRELRHELPRAPVPGDERKHNSLLGPTAAYDRDYYQYDDCESNSRDRNLKDDDTDCDDNSDTASGYYAVPDRINAANEESTHEIFRKSHQPRARRKMLSSSSYSSTAFKYMKSPESSVCSTNSKNVSIYESSVDLEASIGSANKITEMSTSFKEYVLHGASRSLSSTNEISNETMISSCQSCVSSSVHDKDQNLLHSGQPLSPSETSTVDQSITSQSTILQPFASRAEKTPQNCKQGWVPQVATSSASNFHGTQSWSLQGILDFTRFGWYTSIQSRKNQASRPQQSSPRSPNLADFKFLMAQHRFKVHQMTSSSAQFPLDCKDDDNQHDFVLILQGQEVYAYWAELLDFRVEVLGQEVVDVMENQLANFCPRAEIANVADTGYMQGLSIRSTDSSSESSSMSQNEESTSYTNEADDQLSQMITPSIGVRRRRAQTADGAILTKIGSSNDGIQSSMYSTTPLGIGRRPFFNGSAGHISMVSPGIYSQGTTTTSSAISTKGKQHQSLFERAVGTPETLMTSRSINYRSGNPITHSASSLYIAQGLDDPAQQRAAPNTVDCNAHYPLMYLYNSNNMTSNAANRRRWGHQQVQDSQSKTLCSPPVWNLDDRKSDSTSADIVLTSSQKANFAKLTDEPNEKQLRTSPSNLYRDRHEIRMEDIPNPTVARGIAARMNRTNGLQPFLDALKQGIVMRRHRPGIEASFCRIFSNDNGDTIQYVPVGHEEAMNAFKEQRTRFNTSSKRSRACELQEAQSWSLERTREESTEIKPIANSNVDCSAAEEVGKTKTRDEHRIGNSVSRLATKVVSSGSAKAVDIVAVHPARNKDPRSDSGEVGSISLRRSKSEFNSSLSLSLVLRGVVAASRVTRGTKKEKIDELENKWHERQGNEGEFRYLDLEAPTEGEYWLVFRGLLLLHRDAAVGRFARHRAAGIGGLAVHHLGQDECIQLHLDEFHEPKTVGYLEKLVVRLRELDTTYMEGFVLDGAQPPPSDYFLGFRSPGTAIWSRLRQAGLETQRIYSLDRRRVMLKVRCPPDRLLDVAEVLRVKLKTKEGTFAPFREDMIDMYDSKFDASEGPFRITQDFQFSSSIRQSIIDFIIGSRIRDSGAELGQSTELGKMIEARVPLHMHKRLDAIFYAWVHFWQIDNWKGRDGRSLSHEKVAENEKLIGGCCVTYGGADNMTNSTHTDGSKNFRNETFENIPGWFTRVFVGCFYQPLDSIEQYFGEKVAFYFVWLQHTATHLVVLSVVGLIVFSIQLASNNINHPIRPYFSVVVMLWTFSVLINWKKRENFMAYRWGTMNYKEQETTRPQFQGDYKRDTITGDWVVTYPKWKRWLKYCVSIPLTLVFTFGTTMLILLVHSNRDLQMARYVEEMNSASGDTKIHFKFQLSAIGQKAAVVDMDLSPTTLTDPIFWFLVVALPSMLGLCLPLLNFILMRLSVMLNDFENYQTESEYRTYLIVKVFSFRFVCYFVGLYYYAFISVGNELAIENGILRVGTGVLLFTTVAQYWQYFLHVCFPILIRKIRMHYRHKRLCKELGEIELEELEVFNLIPNCKNVDLRERQVQLINKRLLLEQAQDNAWLEMMCPLHDSFPEYIQAVVQFTFVSCFSVVLPITPLIVLLNYLISMRLDAYKLCKGRRRPLAEKTGGIGVWEHLLHIVAVISVLTNCWLMGFTSPQSAMIREKVGDIGMFAIIVGWEHTMLLIRYILSTAISTLPKSVRDSMKKEQYVLDQQRYAMMRARRQQRDHDESFERN